MWAKCRAALKGLQIAHHMKLIWIILEVDSMMLVKIIQGEYSTHGRYGG